MPEQVNQGQKKLRTAAREMGYQDRKRNLAREKNPILSPERLRDEWYAGWDEAQAEDEERKARENQC